MTDLELPTAGSFAMQAARSVHPGRLIAGRWPGGFTSRVRQVGKSAGIVLESHVELPVASFVDLPMTSIGGRMAVGR